MSLTNLPNSISLEADLHLAAADSEKIQGQKQTDLSLKEKFKLIVNNITVEPVIFLFFASAMMTTLANQNLNLEKACRVNIGYNETICDALEARNQSGYTVEQEADVQRLVGKIMSYKMIIQGSIPTLFMLFMGSWSDRHNRRKPAIVLPICGQIMACIGLLISTYYFLELSVEYAMLFESLSLALTGGWFCLLAGIYSYVSGKCDQNSKTVRIGAVSMFGHISVTIGTSLSGIMLRHTGFYGVYSLALTLVVLAAIYSIATIKDDVRIWEPVDKNAKKKGFFGDFFDYRHVMSTFQICVKDGPNNKRKRIIAIMSLVMLTLGTIYGEMNVTYLFTRKKFGWDEVDFSIFNTFHFMTHMMGTIFSLTVFAKHLKLDDALIGIIALVSKMSASLIYAFVPEGKYFYIAALVEVFDASIHISLRSLISKVVPTNELGQINSLFAIAEGLMPLIYGPMYAFFYSYTILDFPGAYYVLSFIINCPAMLTFIWLYRQSISQKKAEVLKYRYQVEHLLNKTKIIEEGS